MDYDYEKFKETFEAEMNKLGNVGALARQWKASGNDRGFPFCDLCPVSCSTTLHPFMEGSSIAWGLGSS